jgi:hypothetical protein
MEAARGREPAGYAEKLNELVTKFSDLLQKDFDIFVTFAANVKSKL